VLKLAGDLGLVRQYKLFQVRQIEEFTGKGSCHNVFLINPSKGNGYRSKDLEN